MTRDPSLGLLDQLVADLAPVKPVPRLWLAVTGPLAAGAAVALTVLLTQGLRSQVWPEFARDVAFFGVLLGLAAIGVGGCTAGLASAIPGRGTAVAIAGTAALIGTATAIGVAATMSPWDAAASFSSSAAAACIGWGLIFSLVPVAAGVRLTRRTWAPRPSVTAGLTLLGATALGSLVVHLSCPVLEGRHVLVGHCSTPLLMAALGGVVLGRWMRSWAR